MIAWKVFWKKARTDFSTVCSQGKPWQVIQFHPLHLLSVLHALNKLRSCLQKHVMINLLILTMPFQLDPAFIDIGPVAVMRTIPFILRNRIALICLWYMYMFLPLKLKGQPVQNGPYAQLWVFVFIYTLNVPKIKRKIYRTAIFNETIDFEGQLQCFP